jgi:8-oxo-dGTP pyrophosphatase MutT (NUDIX family)
LNHGSTDWPALRAAGAHDRAARVPFSVGECAVGSVARAHLAALRAWPHWLQVADDGVTLIAEPHTQRQALAQVNAALRQQGLIRAWRDEAFALFDPQRGTRLTSMERAAMRFWGTLTLGAHATGYVADAQGRPTHLWIAQRSPTKATDPGRYDNLIGGGVPDGQSPWDALVREGFEEAGLTPAQVQPAKAAGVLGLHRDIPEGLQLEWLHAWDLPLPAGLVPANQDGEVAGFHCLPCAEALALASGDAMTVDAALVTLDFALRHGLLPAAQAAPLAQALAARRVQNPAVQAF